jgi:hypothetical protein
MPENPSARAGSPTANELRKEYRAIARRLREAAKAIAELPGSSARAEPACREAKGIVETVLSDLNAIHDRLRVAKSNEQINRAHQLAGTPAGRVDGAPATMATAELIEWLATRHFYEPKARYTVQARNPEQRWYGRAGALARIEGGRSQTSIDLGGDLAMYLLREWPSASDGALKRLGAPAVARLTGGRSEKHLRARVAKLERAKAQHDERRFLLEAVETAITGRDGVLDYHWRRKAAESEAGLMEALDELGARTKVAGCRRVRERISMKDKLFASLEVQNYPIREAMIEARQAAHHSDQRLYAVLLGFANREPRIPFASGALEAALQSVRPPDQAHSGPPRISGP